MSVADLNTQIAVQRALVNKELNRHVALCEEFDAKMASKLSLLSRLREWNAKHADSAAFIKSLDPSAAFTARKTAATKKGVNVLFYNVACGKETFMVALSAEEETAAPIKTALEKEGCVLTVSTGPAKTVKSGKSLATVIKRPVLVTKVAKIEAKPVKVEQTPAADDASEEEDDASEEEDDDDVGDD